MATVSEIDGKLDELERQKAALKEQRKLAAAKEREQARKWKAATLTAMGEALLKALGADWTEIDIATLRDWVSDNADDIRQLAVTGRRTPVEAKEALDVFKRAERDKGAKATAPTQPEPKPDTEAVDAAHAEPETGE